MADGEKLIDAIYEVMREHGTDLLYPEDEFRYCAEHLAGLFEPVGYLHQDARNGPRCDQHTGLTWIRDRLTERICDECQPVYRIKPPVGGESDE